MSDHNDEAGSPELVARRMAEAVLYLSDVARGAGLESISCDLLSIRKKLNRRARSDETVDQRDLNEVKVRRRKP
ncbi:hypothetical protein QA649_11265 [Bradyrhizobium sp. CB1717]|uniref:hypothetical protein n=1 Tax=Bradyrhizobium sp. CB1717 TaxID=3039154 RepID=UPI0024B20355|nr:hypothetical protein [Bradyrhizobium sp. CB1717]WFU26756.1 hypothetical protein QA649_11265 [Bradyrhizobium sp. CB1717]